jgi:hypothetical protein
MPFEASTRYVPSVALVPVWSTTGPPVVVGVPVAPVWSVVVAVVLVAGAMAKLLLEYTYQPAPIMIIRMTIIHTTDDVFIHRLYHYPT